MVRKHKEHTCDWGGQWDGVTGQMPGAHRAEQPGARHVCVLTGPAVSAPLSQKADRGKLMTGGENSPETERRVSSGKPCVGCGIELRGRRRQCRYCSDRCRVRSRRRHQLEQMMERLEQLDQLDEALAHGQVLRARQLLSGLKRSIRLASGTQEPASDQPRDVISVSAQNFGQRTGEPA